MARFVPWAKLGALIAAGAAACYLLGSAWGRFILKVSDG